MDTVILSPIRFFFFCDIGYYRIMVSGAAFMGVSYQVLYEYKVWVLEAQAEINDRSTNKERFYCLEDMPFFAVQNAVLFTTHNYTIAVTSIAVWLENKIDCARLNDIRCFRYLPISHNSEESFGLPLAQSLFE